MRDQEPRDNEKDVDTDEAAAKSGEPGMKGDHGDDRQSPHAVNVEQAIGPRNDMVGLARSVRRRHHRRNVGFDAHAPRRPQLTGRWSAPKIITHVKIVALLLGTAGWTRTTDLLIHSQAL